MSDYHCLNRTVLNEVYIVKFSRRCSFNSCEGCNTVRFKAVRGAWPKIQPALSKIVVPLFSGSSIPRRVAVRSVIQVLTMGWRRDNVSGNPIGGGSVMHIYRG
jgi:hypothetical protein